MKQTNETHDTKAQDPVFEAMKEGFLQLSALQLADGVSWTAPVSDLVELSHLMWSAGYAIDSVGRRVCYQTLIRRLCRNLRVSCPKNPTAVVNNIHRRKSADATLLARCQVLMTREHLSQPLVRFVAPLPRAFASTTQTAPPRPLDRATINGKLIQINV